MGPKNDTSSHRHMKTRSLSPSIRKVRGTATIWQGPRFQYMFICESKPQAFASSEGTGVDLRVINESGNSIAIKPIQPITVYNYSSARPGHRLSELTPNQEPKHKT